MSTKNNEEFLIKRFSRDLEVLEDIDEEKIAQLPDDEYREILQLAKKLTKIDFSGESKAREVLKKKLIGTIEKSKKQSNQSHREFADEELEYVAGGLNEDQENPLRDIEPGINGRQ
jgi:CHAD domain-containing protein